MEAVIERPLIRARRPDVRRRRMPAEVAMIAFAAAVLMVGVPLSAVTALDPPPRGVQLGHAIARHHHYTYVLRHHQLTRLGR